MGACVVDELEARLHTVDRGLWALFHKTNIFLLLINAFVRELVQKFTGLNKESRFQSFGRPYFTAKSQGRFEKLRNCLELCLKAPRGVTAVIVLELLLDGGFITWPSAIAWATSHKTFCLFPSQVPEGNEPWARSLDEEARASWKTCLLLRPSRTGRLLRSDLALEDKISVAKQNRISVSMPYEAAGVPLVACPYQTFVGWGWRGIFFCKPCTSSK